MAFVYPAELDLREGCELASKPKSESNIILRRLRSEEKIALTPAVALSYAQSAAKSFGVGEGRNVTFDKQEAKKALKAVEKDKE